MKHPHVITLAALTATLALTLSACDHGANAATKTVETATPVVPPPIAPTEERVVQRATSAGPR